MNLLLMEDGFNWNNPLVVSALITLGSTVIVLIIYFISQKVTGGRGMLYKFVQDYGYDHPITLDMLKNIADKILSYEGYHSYSDLYLGHEVGNRFEGSFYTNDIDSHGITIITDGWTLNYSIDGGPMRTYKG